MTLDGLKLTERQRRFVDYYVADPNATQAALAAGYSKKTARTTGQENMTKPAIRAAIDERLAQLESARIADATEVLQFLTATMRGEKTDEVVAFNSEFGEFYHDKKKVDMRTSVRAAELLAKRYRLLDDPPQTGGNMLAAIVEAFAHG